MAICGNCQTSLEADQWFCEYCGQERSDCIKCGERLSKHSCSSCSAAVEAPCEECGAEISADLRQCPQCGYDSGAEYEEKGERSSLLKLAMVGGGFLLLLFVGNVLISIMAGIMGNGGILETIFTGIMWIMVILGAGAYLILGGGVAILDGGWASFRNSQAERAIAADVDRAERLNRTQEYVEEQRRKKEEKKQKKKEQRHRTHVQCPDCGWNVEMVVEGQVIDVDTNDGSLGAVDSALDTIGADTSKDCPHCDVTIHASTELL